jgi:hypothetical protein
MVIVTITNNSASPISNWAICFDYADSIENIWDAVIEANANGAYIIRNNVYNESIPVGGSVSFGFTSTYSENTVLPTFIKIVPNVVKPINADISYLVYYDDEYSLSSAILITNNTGSEIKNWTLTFDMDRSIQSVSNANVSGTDGISYALTYPEYASHIALGATTQIGVTGNAGVIGTTPTNFSLSGLVPMYDLVTDTDGDGVLDFIEVCVNGTNPEVFDNVTVTPTVTPEVTEEITPTVTEAVTPAITTVPIPTDDIDMDIKDSDSDGLLDNMEGMYRTDPNNPDSDSDGLLDGNELDIGSNPLAPDTDGNGVTDFDEDYDGDGISNGEEYSTDTCMFASDSDYDGVNDFEELNTFGTEPRNEDSDLDGIVDGDEVILGLDPSSDDSDSDGVTDDYETFFQSLSFEVSEDDHPKAVSDIQISGDISGLISSNTTIEDLYNRDVYCSNTVGLLGVPFNIETEGYFDSMTLTLTYDEQYLTGSNESDIGVLWFDEESGFFIIQEQAVVDTQNNTVTLELAHFSTYMMVDLSIWNSIEPIDYDIPTEETNYDFYCAFDLSQHMSVTARNNALEAFQTLLDNMSSGDRVCVFYFDTTYTVDGIYDIDDKAAINELLIRVTNNLRGASLGGDYGSLVIPFQVTDAIIDRLATDVGNIKELLIFTNDTEITHTPRNANIMSIAKENGDFSAEFLMMANTNEGAWNYAWQYAEESDSGYYKYPSYKSLLDPNYWGEGVVYLKNLDSDGDGIANYLEEQGIMAPNGEIITSDPNLVDTDSDGINDQDEFGTIYVFRRDLDGRHISILVDGNLVYDNYNNTIDPESEYYGYLYIFDVIEPGGSITMSTRMSNPSSPDSDEDGYLDCVDADPDRHNTDRIYVFSNPDFRDSALLRAEEYQHSGHDVTFREFYDVLSFEEAWNGIGLFNSYYFSGKKPFGDKYYYNAENVVICSHGSPDGIILNGSEQSNTIALVSSTFISGDRLTSGNNVFISTGRIVHKRIDSLNLYSCSCGAPAPAEEMNLAESFLQDIPGISQVIAADSTLYFVGQQYLFFSYRDFHEYSESEYDTLYISVDKVRYFYYEDYVNLSNVEGFVIFRRDFQTTDYYSDDVVFGTLYATANNYENRCEGILVFDQYPFDYLEDDDWNDPILG